MPRKQIDELSLKILETAQSLFDEYGIENVSMHKVAQTSGVGQGTLYRRYPSKSNLCKSLMDNEFDKFIRQVDAYLEEAASEAVQTRLNRVIAMLVRLAGRDLEWLKVMIASSRHREAGFNLNELPPYVYIRDTVEKLLLEASAHNQLIDLEAEFAASVIASAFTPELIVQLYQLGYDADQIAERYCQSFIAPLFVE